MEHTLYYEQKVGVSSIFLNADILEPILEKNIKMQYSKFPINYGIIIVIIYDLFVFFTKILIEMNINLFYCWLNMT